MNPALAPACFTGFGYDLAGAVALPAASADGKETLLIADLARPFAGRTGNRRFSFRSTAAATGGAGILTGYLDLCFEAESRFLE